MSHPACKNLSSLSSCCLSLQFENSWRMSTHKISRNMIAYGLLDTTSITLYCLLYSINYDTVCRVFSLCKKTAHGQTRQHRSGHMKILWYLFLCRSACIRRGICPQGPYPSGAPAERPAQAIKHPFQNGRRQRVENKSCP